MLDRAKLAAEIYKPEIEMNVPSYYKMLTFLETSLDVQCAVFQFEDEILIVFRGTKELADFMVDAYFVQENLMLYVTSDFLCKAHAGFKTAYESIRPLLHNLVNKDFIEKNKIKDVYLVGHSLGGAMATIAALDFGYLLEDKATTHCVTFGCPRVGDLNFKNLFHEHVDHSYRFVNSFDPVPNLPPGDIKKGGFHVQYEHVNGKVKLNRLSLWEALKLIIKTRDPMAFIKFHGIDRYVKGLNFEEQYL